MALTDFKPQFDNAYEDIFNKTLVGKAIANLRFEPLLRYGQKVTRVLLDLDGVAVRETSRGAASTIDAVTDSTEDLEILYEFEAAFHISDGEVTQAGPLNPGEVIGRNIGEKVAANLDYRILKETVNAANDFDNGDLTTSNSSGTPITLSSTTVPQMVTRLPAKLRARAFQTLTNMCFVCDPYVASDLAQYLLGKNFDIVNYIWKNGYSEEEFARAEVYISDNLCGEASFTISGTEGILSLYPNATISINGVTFKFTTSLSAAGDLSVATGTSVLVTYLNCWKWLSAALNKPYTSNACYYAHSSTSAAVLGENMYTMSLTNGVSTAVIRGPGRLTLTEKCSTASFSSPHLHCYYGKKGAIDVVVQDIKSADMRQCADRRGTNVFANYLAGIKTFTDGAKKMLDVLIWTGDAAQY
jgi:hypothetical protein